MLGNLTHFIYNNCCWRARPNNYVRFNAALEIIEELTEEEIDKLVQYYNKRIC